MLRRYKSKLLGDGRREVLLVCIPARGCTPVGRSSFTLWLGVGDAVTDIAARAKIMDDKRRIVTVIGSLVCVDCGVSAVDFDGCSLVGADTHERIVRTMSF